MTEAKYTAGPWMVEPISNGLTYQVTTSEQTGFKVICETDWGDDVDAANARLIAAAPALLKAVTELSAFVGVMCGIGPNAIIPATIATPLGIDIKIGAIMRDAAAALAKAGASS